MEDIKNEIYQIDIHDDDDVIPELINNDVIPELINNDVIKQKEVIDTPEHEKMRLNTKDLRRRKIEKFGIEEVRFQEKMKKRFQMRRKKLEKQGVPHEEIIKPINTQESIFENILDDIIESNKRTLKENCKLIYNLYILLFDEYTTFDINFLLDKERIDNFIRNSDMSIKSKYSYYTAIVSVIRRYDKIIDNESQNSLESTLSFYTKTQAIFKILL